jgi:hypothetical protein
MLLKIKNNYNSYKRKSNDLDNPDTPANPDLNIQIFGKFRSSNFMAIPNCTILLIYIIKSVEF